MRRRAASAIAALAAAAALALTSCQVQAAPSSGETSGSTPITAVTTVYPLQYLTQRIGGDRVTVRPLLADRSDQHGVELSLRQVRTLAAADLVVYLADFQPAVDSAIAAQRPRALNVAPAAQLLPYGELDHDHHLDDGHDHGTIDPHFWLDPARAAAVSQTIADQLAAVDPPGASQYQARATQLAAELTDLAERYRDTLKTCAQRTLLVSHAAFGYLAHTYGLHQESLAGLDAESEPSLARMRQMRQTIIDQGVTTIYYETGASSAAATSLATALNIRAAELNPLERPPSHGNYLTTLQANLTALRTGLSCQ